MPFIWGLRYRRGYKYKSSKTESYWDFFGFFEINQFIVYKVKGQEGLHLILDLGGRKALRTERGAGHNFCNGFYEETSEALNWEYWLLGYLVGYLMNNK